MSGTSLSGPRFLSSTFLPFYFRAPSFNRIVGKRVSRTIKGLLRNLVTTELGFRKGLLFLLVMPAAQTAPQVELTEQNVLQQLGLGFMV